MIALFPDDPKYLMTMAEIYRQQKEWEKSISNWKQVAERDPDFLTAHLALIELYAGQKQTKRCYPHIDILMKNNRENQYPN